jgi:AbrB family looped-hinge helix DNA binding protein
MSCLTPKGQVTIPRSILKALGISGEDNFSIEVENDRLILKKVTENPEKKENKTVYQAG